MSNSELGSHKVPHIPPVRDTLWVSVPTCGPAGVARREPCPKDTPHSDEEQRDLASIPGPDFAKCHLSGPLFSYIRKKRSVP